jgi:hypothetical protein
MTNYRKKPVVIQAVQLTPTTIAKAYDFIYPNDTSNRTSCKMAEDKWWDYEKLVEKEGLKIKTLEGEMTASMGDFIIKGVSGEFYPCKPDIFEKTYELAD